MAKKQQKESPGIIGLIEDRSRGRITQSINKWRQAITSFESPTNPIRTYLYDMYSDMLLDGQLEATWSKRRDNILNKRLTFVRDGVEDEEITKLLNSPDMRDILRELHNSIGWGYTLIQINRIWFDDEQECYRVDHDLIPRENVHPEPKFECISKNASIITYDWLYRNPPLSNYMLYAGEAKDKGLFVKVAPYIIYKRGATGDWSQFSEMFGMPFREAIYDAFDDDTRRKIESMLQNWGAGASFVHQKNVEVKLTSNDSASSSSEVYEHFIQICDASISKTILGNTLTTEQGYNGARSLGEVHEAEEDNKKKSDELFILSILNTRFRSILKRFGMNVTGGEIWFESPDKDWASLQNKWDIINGISDKIPIADDYIYEEFDIPKPDDYDFLKEEMRQSKLLAFTPLFSEEKTDEPHKKEKTDAENKFFSRLLNFFA